MDSFRDEMALQPHLTPTQLQAFYNEGYLVMRQMANAERIAAMRQRAFAQPPQTLQAPISVHDPAFEDWAGDDRLTAILAQLLDSPSVWLARSHYNCLLYAASRGHSEPGWRRDLDAWSFATPCLINAWLALSEQNKHTGCPTIIPGSHTAEVSPEQLDAHGQLLSAHADNARWLASARPVALEPGDVLFYHAGVYHAPTVPETETQDWLAVITTYFGQDNMPVAGSVSASQPAQQVR